MFQVKFDGSDVERLGKALKTVPREFRGYVIPRALNETGDGLHTLVVRNLVKTTGAKPGRVRRVVVKKRATAGFPMFVIKARDPYMTLKDFGPRQGSKGASAAPWGKRRVFPGTFIGPGGHVFARAGKGRFPIKKLYGPSIPKEMLRPDNAEPVKQLIAKRLPERVLYWAGRAIARAK